MMTLTGVRSMRAVVDLCACWAAATRSIGTVGYCDACAEELLAPMRARIFADECGVGCGVQRGLRRPDYGRNWAELACNVCPATWVGLLGETCDWCIVRLSKQHLEQRKLLLRPSLPDRADTHRSTAVKAWLQRLARGVDAELITSTEADRVALIEVSA